MSVTASQELCKQPSEKRKFGMEFAHLIDSDNSEILSTIDSVTSVTVSEGTSDLTITLPAVETGLVASSKVTFWIEGGTSGIKYRIEVQVTTSAGQILEGDGLLLVTDR